MTDHDALLAQLEQHGKMLERQTDQLSKIEIALTNMAVQEKDISHMRDQITALWRKYDVAMGPEGVLSKVRLFQGACPGEDLKKNILQLWGAMGLLLTIIAAIKIWG